MLECMAAKFSMGQSTLKKTKLFLPILQKEIEFVVRMMSKRDMIDRQGRVRSLSDSSKGPTNWKM